MPLTPLQSRNLSDLRQIYAHCVEHSSSVERSVSIIPGPWSLFTNHIQSVALDNAASPAQSAAQFRSILEWAKRNGVSVCSFLHFSVQTSMLNHFAFQGYHSDSNVSDNNNSLEGSESEAHAALDDDYEDSEVSY